MSESAVSFDDLLFLTINLNRYLDWYRLLCLFAVACLTVSRLSPAINIIFLVDSYRVIGSTSYGDYRCLFESFGTLRVVVLEEVRYVVR